MDDMSFQPRDVGAGTAKPVIERPISAGAPTDPERWVDEHGTRKTEEEKRAWCDEVAKTNPYDNPEQRDWYVEQLQPLGLDPKTTPLFDWLDADDRARGRCFGESGFVSPVLIQIKAMGDNKFTNQRH